jgi:Uncharacterised protein family (UPF0175)
MMQIAMTLPGPVAEQLRTWSGQDLPRHMREMVALEGYRSGALSAYQVQEVLGYETRDELYGFLKEHGVPLRYTPEHLQRAREAHDRLGI